MPSTSSRTPSATREAGGRRLRPSACVDIALSSFKLPEADRAQGVARELRPGRQGADEVARIAGAEDHSPSCRPRRFSDADNKKIRYTKLVRWLHPDKSQATGAMEAFQRCEEAKRVLCATEVTDLTRADDRAPEV